MWHGARFRELSYFWDEEAETLLSTCCPNCFNIISVDEILEASAVQGVHAPSSNNRVHLSCTECTFEFIHTVTTMKGNPLNQAFIFHEDGFNAFSKKSRGIAAIHISEACTKKSLRLQNKSLRVYSFVPTYLLKEGIPHKMDAWTSEEKGKGVAKIRTLTDKLGGWKSNEFKRYHDNFYQNFYLGLIFNSL